MRSIAFFNKKPVDAEVTLLAKFLGTFRDGSGNYPEDDGTTRADYKQIEVSFAELLGGKAFGNKKYYDFCVSENDSGGITVRGASIKSKELADIADFPKVNPNLRSHMEVSNSSAADWKLCAERGLTKADWIGDASITPAERNALAQKFGQLILDRQSIQRQKHEDEYIKHGHAKKFAHDHSIFISLLYTQPVGKKKERQYLVASYPIYLPKPHKWEFRAPRSSKSGNPTLVGYDEEGGVLYEWFALSGSQFKYYPKLKNALYLTPVFELPKPAPITLQQKARELFGAG